MPPASKEWLGPGTTKLPNAKVGIIHRSANGNVEEQRGAKAYQGIMFATWYTAAGSYLGDKGERKKQNGEANDKVRKDMHVVAMVAVGTGNTPPFPRSKRRDKNGFERDVLAAKSTAPGEV